MIIDTNHSWYYHYQCSLRAFVCVSSFQVWQWSSIRFQWRTWSWSPSKGQRVPQELKWNQWCSSLLIFRILKLYINVNIKWKQFNVTKSCWFSKEYIYNSNIFFISIIPCFTRLKQTTIYYFNLALLLTFLNKGANHFSVFPFLIDIVAPDWTLDTLYIVRNAVSISSPCCFTP